MNNKRYVGITSHTAEHRLKGHIYDAKKGSKFAIHHAIRKYGAESFIVEELCCTWDREFLKELEIRFIEELNTHFFDGFGYNMTKGGDNAGAFGTCPAKDSMSGELLGRIDLDDPRWKAGEIVPANKGHKVSESSRKLMSEFAKTRTGEKGSNAKRYRLTSPDGVKYSVFGGLKKFCEEHGLKFSALYDYVDKGGLVPPCGKYSRHPKSFERENTIGWRIERI